MIFNAKLTLVKEAPAPDGRGGETPGTTTAVDVDCCLTRVSKRQRDQLADRIALATAVAYIPLPTAGVAEFKKRQRLAFVQDGAASPVMEAVEVIKRVHDAGESHWQVFLKGP